MRPHRQKEQVRYRMVPGLREVHDVVYVVRNLAHRTGPVDPDGDIPRTQATTVVCIQRTAHVGRGEWRPGVSPVAVVVSGSIQGTTRSSGWHRCAGRRRGPHWVEGIA